MDKIFHSRLSVHERSKEYIPIAHPDCYLSPHWLDQSQLSQELDRLMVRACNAQPWISLLGWYIV